MESILKTDDISMIFGGLTAVSNFSCDIKRGELVGLIGPNGAGKTTVFNMLTGIYIPSSGQIYFSGKRKLVSTNNLKPNQITRLGIARTFQNIRLFKNLSVLDNVKIAFHFQNKYPVINGILRFPSFFRKESELEQLAIDLLKIFDIQGKKDELAKNLPYGEQRKLEIVRALATNPQLLLLDEPAAGMNPQETKELMQLIKFIREKFNITILLIEHDMTLVMGICERIYVLDYGKTIAEGTPDLISKDPVVIKAYLGEEA
jgi:branched-chain amino acid transport system ATP-binding protein